MTLEVRSAGETALVGQVLSTNPEPIPGVKITLGDKQAITDAGGNFMLTGVPAGRQLIFVDGRPASTPTKEFPIVENEVELVANQTNRLPYIIFLPRIDTTNKIPIDPAPTEDVVATTPTIPKLEVKILAGTIITTMEGEVVDEISMTPVPLDRPPMPLPEGVVVASGSLFTLQPGGAVPSQPIPITFPNVSDATPGTQMDLWFFDVEVGDWRKYGTGKVSEDGTQVIPDPGVGLPRLAWHFPATAQSDQPGATRQSKKRRSGGTG